MIGRTPARRPGGGRRRAPTEDAYPAGLVVLSLDGRILRYNATLLELSGRTVAPRHFIDLLTPAARLFWLSRFGPPAAGRLPGRTVSLDLQRPDGAPTPVAAAFRPVRDGVGGPAVHVALVAAGPRRERLGVERTDQPWQAPPAVDPQAAQPAVPDPAPDVADPVEAQDDDVVLLGFDPDGRCDLVAGDETTAILTRRPDPVGTAADELLADRPGWPEAVRRALAGESTTTCERHGDRHWQVAVRPRRGAGGAEAGATVVAVDVTGHHELRAELDRRALVDAVTGLFNRDGMQQAVERAVERAVGLAGDPVGDPTEPAGDQVDIALLCLDLDDFKDVNDSFGHAAGDRVLAAVAARLAAGVPEGAVVARQGGDEFVVLLGPGSHDQPDLVARRLVRSLAAPLVVDGLEPLQVRASVGVSRWPLDAADAEELLAHADAAMYRAKAGGLEVAAYDGSRDDARRRFELTERLRRAIADGVVRAHFQPLVDLRDGRLRSVEALVRWHDEVLGDVPAGRLVAAAESARLVDGLGALVLDRTVAQLAAWDAAGLRVQRAAVNVSPRQLRSGALLPALDAAIERHGVSPERLTIEVTESLVVALDESALRTLGRLRQRGVLVALDDFGTGNSSLARLRELPVDVVKLDRSFVVGLPGTVPAALLDAFVGVARALGLATVAEGVETPVQRDILTELGCDVGQGYLFGAAVPGEDLLGLFPAGP